MSCIQGCAQGIFEPQATSQPLSSEVANTEFH
jgi:hypothetical protein